MVASCSSEQRDPITLDGQAGDALDADVTSELQLMAVYAAVLESYPELENLLAPIAEQHSQHAQALGAGSQAPQTNATVPETARDAVRQLIAAEDRAARERRDACAVEDEATRVRVLTLIAASEASHARQLAQWERESA